MMKVHMQTRLKEIKDETTSIESLLQIFYVFSFLVFDLFQVVGSESQGRFRGCCSGTDPRVSQSVEVHGVVVGERVLELVFHHKVKVLQLPVKRPLITATNQSRLG